jgi:hypothetical protein
MGRIAVEPDCPTISVMQRGWYFRNGAIWAVTWSVVRLLLRRAATVVAARISCAVQPFLWYCLGVGRVSPCFWRAHVTDLAPLRRGFFTRFPALCATNEPISPLPSCHGTGWRRRQSTGRPDPFSLRPTRTHNRSAACLIHWQ